MSLNIFLVEQKKRDFYKKRELKKILLKSLLKYSKSPVLVKKKIAYLLKFVYSGSFQNVCLKSKRFKGVYTCLGISRMFLRKIVSNNFISGFYKASW